MGCGGGGSFQPLRPVAVGMAADGAAASLVLAADTTEHDLLHVFASGGATVQAIPVLTVAGDADLVLAVPEVPCPS